MIKLASTDNCTGCGLCMQVCPHKAINMIEDNEGFKQPVINLDKCIECGLCIRKCPQMTKAETYNCNDFEQLCYAAYSYKYQKNGSSGGLFSSIADYVLSNHGVVYGAAFDEEFKLKHIGITSESQMQQLRGSKYLQSDLGFIFKEVKENLENNIMVLFSGTPCQVDGLKSFLGKKRYDGLITIDLVCHGVPSQKAFDKLMETIIKKYGKIKNFQFRKLDGWSILPRITNEKGKIYSLRYDMEAYMWAFYKGYLFRECCYNCKYANLNRNSDITLADFWGIGNYGTPFKCNQTHGISLVLINTLKGKLVFDSLKNIYKEERTLKEALNKQHNLKSPSIRPQNRDYTANDFISKMSMLEFSKKYNLLPRNKNLYVITSKIKDTLIDWGFFDVMKDTKNRIKKLL